MKARDIIPGWPRGRSTSMSSGSPARLMALYADSISWFYGRLLVDPRFAEDIAAERAEEARKARMMQDYYNSKMQEVMGDLVNDVICPWNPTFPIFTRSIRNIIARNRTDDMFWRYVLGTFNGDQP